MERRDAVEEGLIYLGGRGNGKAYQKWLTKLVNGHHYQNLLDILHNIEFTWGVDFDENRAEEGMALRYRFAIEMNRQYDEAGDDYPCSVLEMLIALAISMEDSILYDAEQGDRTAEWFWMMMDNLEIAYPDSQFNGSRRKQEALRDHIFVKVQSMLDRDYNRAGKGSLFPVRHYRRDMRDEELWKQANIYAVEELL